MSILPGASREASQRYVCVSLTRGLLSRHDLSLFMAFASSVWHLLVGKTPAGYPRVASVVSQVLEINCSGELLFLPKRALCHIEGPEHAFVASLSCCLQYSHLEEVT